MVARDRSIIRKRQAYSDWHIEQSFAGLLLLEVKLCSQLRTKVRNSFSTPVWLPEEGCFQCFVTTLCIQTVKLDSAAIAKTSNTLAVEERVRNIPETTSYDLPTRVLLCLTEEFYGMIVQGETMCRQKDLSFPGMMREYSAW